MTLTTIATMIFAIGSVYGGLIATLIYFFKKKTLPSDLDSDN